VLAGTAGADKAVLRAAVAFDLSIFEGFPIGLLVAEPPDISLRDLSSSDSTATSAGIWWRVLAIGVLSAVFPRHYTPSRMRRRRPLDLQPKIEWFIPRKPICSESAAGFS